MNDVLNTYLFRRYNFLLHLSTSLFFIFVCMKAFFFYYSICFTSMNGGEGRKGEEKAFSLYAG